MAASPKKVLSLWQARHGLLSSNELREEFLARPATKEIAAFPVQWIRRTFQHEKQLETALKVLNWRAAMKFQYEEFVRQRGVEPIPQSGSDPWYPAESNLQITPGAVADLDVVGESFYRENFSRLRSRFRASGNSRYSIVAELRLDPNNQFSASGRAVKVLVEGMQVGHVPERIAPSVYDLIEPMGDSAFIPGAIWFDEPSKTKPMNSVKISPSMGSAGKRGAVPPGPLPKKYGQTQADDDSQRWRLNHPVAPGNDGVWGEVRGKVSGRKSGSKTRVSLKFFCSACKADAGSAKGKCIQCGSKAGMPRSGRKTLLRSRQAAEDRAAALRAKPLETVMGDLTAEPNHTKKLGEKSQDH